MNMLRIVCLLFLCFCESITYAQYAGQLFVVPISPQMGKQHVEEVALLINSYHIGSVIFMPGTSREYAEARKILEERVSWPLLTLMDAEWGIGMRVSDLRPLPKNAHLEGYDLQNFGQELARQCLTIGIQGNLAPVVDINSNPNNPVFGERSFGKDPRDVAAKGLAVMKGMQGGGVLTCAKHFPGHGDTETDSHLELPRIEKSLSEIQACELIPFKALIDGGVDMVMVGHLLFPALDPVYPATLSRKIVTGLLKEELGFTGIVITDALNMRALTRHYSAEEIALRAFDAGCDLLLYATNDPEGMKKLIKDVIPRSIEVIRCERGFQ